MARINSRIALAVALRLVITCLFIPAILVKLRHPHEWAALFIAWGYPGWGPLAVSSAEIVSLLLLWVPRLAPPAIGVLTITLTGAVGTWLIHGPRATAAYPGIILLVLWWLAWLELRTRRLSTEGLGTATA